MWRALLPCPRRNSDAASLGNYFFRPRETCPRLGDIRDRAPQDRILGGLARTQIGSLSSGRTCRRRYQATEIGCGSLSILERPLADHCTGNAELAIAAGRRTILHGSPPFHN